MIVRWPGQIARGSARGDLVSTQDLAPTMLSLAGVEVADYMQGRVFLGKGTQPEPEYLYFHRDRMDEVYELMRAARDHRYKYIRNYHVRRTYAQDIQYMNMMPTLVGPASDGSRWPTDASTSSILPRAETCRRTL